MSGHSHWATIQRQKGAKDAAKGKIFSKLARAITIAAKSGVPNPDSNLTLRMAIEKARESNMPKENIERAIAKASTSEALEEIQYEGFGPCGIAVIIDAATDNRNRTSQEMKNLLDRYNGKLGGPGSVSYNFIHSGLIIVKKPDNADESVMLEIIDMGVDDVQESDGVYEIYVKIADLENVKEQLKLKFTIESSDIIQKPVNMAKIETEDVQKVMNFLQALDDHEDVQKVFTNADFPQ